MYLMQLDKISDRANENLRKFFDDLPETAHADGRYRLRRYSKVQMSLETMIYTTLEGNQFTQSSEFNTFQGDIARTFESLSPELIRGFGFWELASRFTNTCRLPSENVIETHQMRIRTLDELTPVSPEGAHQDGYDALCIASIARTNITGGRLLVSREKDLEPVVNLQLKEGEVVYINDRALWHNATPIKRIDESKDGYMDVFVLTARYNATT
jgi:hypothetical protein